MAHCECCPGLEYCEKCEPCVSCDFEVSKEERQAWLEFRKLFDALKEEKGWEETLLQLVETNRQGLAEVITPEQIGFLTSQGKIKKLYPYAMYMKLESIKKLWENEKDRAEIKRSIAILLGGSCYGTEEMKFRDQIRELIGHDF